MSNDTIKTISRIQPNTVFTTYSSFVTSGGGQPRRTENWDQFVNKFGGGDSLVKILENFDSLKDLIKFGYLCKDAYFCFLNILLDPSEKLPDRWFRRFEISDFEGKKKKCTLKNSFAILSNSLKISAILY